MEAMAKKTPLADFLSMVWRRFQEDRCLQIASSLTFTTLLALVPIITVMLTLMSLFPVFSDMAGKTEKFFLQNMLPESVATIATYTEQFTQNAGKLTAVGIVFLFVTSIIVLMTIERALNGSGALRGRVPWSSACSSTGRCSVGLILVGASLYFYVVAGGPFARAGGGGSARGNGSAQHRAGGADRGRLHPALSHAAQSARLLRDAALGGFLAAIGFEWMKHGFALYITQFATYKLVMGHSPACRSSCCGYSWVVVLTGAVVAAVAPEWRSAPRRESLRPVRCLSTPYVLKCYGRPAPRGTASPSRNYTRQ